MLSCWRGGARAGHEDHLFCAVMGSSIEAFQVGCIGRTALCNTDTEADQVDQLIKARPCESLHSLLGSCRYDQVLLNKWFVPPTKLKPLAAVCSASRPAAMAAEARTWQICTGRRLQQYCPSPAPTACFKQALLRLLSRASSRQG